MSPSTMSIKKHLSIIMSLLVSLPSKICGFYFTIKELSKLLSVGGCPHGLVNVDMVTQALGFNRGKVPGILSNSTNNIRRFYKIVRGELMPSVSPNSQFKKNRPRMIVLLKVFTRSDTVEGVVRKKRKSIYPSCLKCPRAPVLFFHFCDSTTPTIVGRIGW